MSGLRCLDAHVTLGEWKFNGSKEHHKMFIELERKHYEVGIAIAELSLPKDFNGLLPWGVLATSHFFDAFRGMGYVYGDWVTWMRPEKFLSVYYAQSFGWAGYSAFFEKY